MPRENSTLFGDGLLNALSLATEGRVYELASDWWRGMPSWDQHPRFDVIAYRTPKGERNQKDIAMVESSREGVDFGFVSELIMGTTHTGTHIDALCHVTCGRNDEWFGGYSANEYLGDFGAFNNDAAALPPIVGRGVLYDIPALLGLEALPPRYPVGPDELQGALDQQGVEARPGDTAIIRTGQMRYWPDAAQMAEKSGGAGLTIDGARWLHERGATAVAGDTVLVELEPSGIPGNPQPVHAFLIQEKGVPIIEWLSSEAISQDAVYEFLFLCLPLTIKGATGSMIRPVAIV